MRQTRVLPTRPAFALFFLLSGVVVASALALSVIRAVQDRRYLTTGPARWIWLTRDLEVPAPLSFFAAREFDWNGALAGPARALLFVDRSHVLFVNGVRAGEGEQKRGDSLRAYEVSRLLHRGRNRVVIEARSPDGVGGILFSLQLPGGETLVSDASWRVGRSEKALVPRGSAAIVWGRPPMYPWGYPAAPGRD